MDFKNSKLITLQIAKPETSFNTKSPKINVKIIKVNHFFNEIKLDESNKK